MGERLSSQGPDVESKVAIEFAGVAKSYGGVQVLRSVDLQITRGEKVALIGPSGSGKTTVLRTLMTFERPDSGRVMVGGTELWRCERRGRMVPAGERHLRRMRGKVGMVFQHYTLFPHMTVLNNVTEGPIHVRKMASDEAVDLAERLLDMVGMRHLGDRKPGQLSGGQRQRVAIARALAMQPEVMLFDEVTSALDPELVGEVLKVIKDVGAASDVTMLLVTHEMQFARHFADTVLMFDQGTLVESGTPEHIFSDRASERTQKFLDAVLSPDRL